jgi:GT2 family glycosyltransferase
VTAHPVTDPTDPAGATGPTGPTDGADVAVVIVTHRCRDHVIACLQALRSAAEHSSVQVVVVDNDSRDGTLAALVAGDDRPTVIAMGRNAGFACAVNRGIAATRSRHVLVLNPDTTAAPGSVDRLVRFADATPGAGAIAPRLRNGDGTDQATARAFPTPAAALFGRRSPLTRAFPTNRWSARFLTGRDHRGDEPFAVDWVSGACVLVPRAVVDRVGGLDETFFLYWEDADWCRRIKAAGYGVWCVPRAEVVHAEGGSRGHVWPAPVVRHFHRGAYRYWTKHHAPQWWNPLRWVAAGALAVRCAAVLAATRARPTGIRAAGAYERGTR